MMKKFLTRAILMALVAMTMTCSAFAATAAPDEPSAEPEVVYYEPDSPVGDTGIIGMPVGNDAHRVRSWLAEQVRFKTIFANSYYDGELYVAFRLTDATKIIFIANEVCPVEYDQYGNLWVSNIDIPCGINMRDYRFLDLTSRLAAEYGEGGVETLTDLYTADELSEIYAELKELAPTSYSALIAWLDSCSVGVTVPAPLPTPTREPAPTDSYKTPYTEGTETSEDILPPPNPTPDEACGGLSSIYDLVTTP